MLIQISITYSGAAAIGLIAHGVYSLSTGHIVRGAVEIWIGAKIAHSGGPLVVLSRTPRR